jgi:hypothetical protein
MGANGGNLLSSHWAGTSLDETKRAFCQAYMDQFFALVARFADPSVP